MIKYKKIIIIASLFYALLIFTFGIIEFEYLLSTIHTGFEEYIRNEKIHSLVSYQLTIYYIFFLYFTQVFRLIKLKILYSPFVHVLIIILWLFLSHWFHYEEVTHRMTFDYGNVLDKHADSILYLWLYPIFYFTLLIINIIRNIILKNKINDK